MLDVVMSTIGTILDNPSTIDRHAATATECDPSSCPDPYGVNQRHSYRFKPWEGREYINETFDIGEDVAIDRRIAQCATVFQRVRSAFYERFRNKDDVIESFQKRPSAPPKYPQPMGGKGGLIYLRHVHKTGGSTIRHLFHTFSDWTHTPYAPKKQSMDDMFDKFASYQRCVFILYLSLIMLLQRMSFTNEFLCLFSEHFGISFSLHHLYSVKAKYQNS